MKKLALIVILAVTTAVSAQTLGAAQRAGVTAHVNEIAGHLGLLQIDCPTSPAPILPSDPFLCFSQPFGSADLFRMSWDLHNDELFIATASTGLAPWALDSATGAVHRSFNLPGVAEFTVVYTIEGTTGTVRLGASPR